MEPIVQAKHAKQTEKKYSTNTKLGFFWKICLFHVDNMLPSANKQSDLVFFSLSMFETRCNPSFLGYYTWLKIRQEPLCFMTLYFPILDCTSSQGSIQFNSLDGSSSCFILLKRKFTIVSQKSHRPTAYEIMSQFSGFQTLTSSQQGFNAFLQKQF